MADQILEQIREAAEGQIDFEGQKLAEFLGTALLATIGVRIHLPAECAIDRLANRVPGHFFHRRLLSPRHQTRSLHRTGWNCPYLPRRRSTVAVLQQTSCQMAASKRK